jgi:murein DD-endopeptidase MepM/ murein hydrolase activator NlpD
VRCTPPRTVRTLVAVLALAVFVPAAAAAHTHAMALDAALRAGGFYLGAEPGPAAAASRLHRIELGSRPLRPGETGFDVAELQLALAWQGFPSGRIDGRFGAILGSALARFQRGAGLPADGVAGGATIAALRRVPPGASIPLVWPLLAHPGDGFGPRGNRFHAGLDLPAPKGDAVIAAAPGRVVWAGPRPGGWGTLVTIAHGHGVRTMYAHLSAVDVKLGQWVAGGTVVGRVGATGDATGPHLHFEVRIGNAAVDPLRALVPLPPGSFR